MWVCFPCMPAAPDQVQPVLSALGKLLCGEGWNASLTGSPGTGYDHVTRI